MMFVAKRVVKVGAAAAAVLLMALQVGCSEDNPGSQQCAVDEDCAASQICRAGVCLSPQADAGPDTGGADANVEPDGGDESDGGEADAGSPDGGDAAIVNEAPTADAVTAQTDEEVQVSIELTGSDPNGDSLSFTLVDEPAHGSLTLAPGDGTFATAIYTPNPDFAGDDTFTYSVNDGQVESEPAEVTVTVAGSNDAPTFTSTPSTFVLQNELYSYTARASDVDANDTLELSLLDGPSWLTLTDNGDGTALVEGTPGDSDVGQATVELSVEDAAGETDSQLYTLTVSNTNDAPSFDSAPVTAATEDALYEYAIVASDADAGDNLEIAGVVVPSWLELTDNGDGTALLEGTPGDAEAGTNVDVEIQVRDVGGLKDTQTFTIAVSNINDAPMITSTPQTLATTTQPYSYEVVVEDPDPAETVTVTAPTLPAFLTLAAPTGSQTNYVVQGTPQTTDIGSYNVVLEVSDAQGAQDSQSFTITVDAENILPTADATANRKVQTGIATTLDGTASFDPDGAQSSLSFAWALTQDPSNGVDQIQSPNSATASLTPSAAGTYIIELTVTDADGATDIDQITVETFDPPSGDCLIISEYVEGSGSNKAIELYNCGSSVVDLNPYTLCLVSNDATNCKLFDQELGTTLSAGATRVLCNHQASFPSKSTVCDDFSGVTNFNGNDRLVLWVDADGNTLLDPSETRIDAFGETAVRPPSLIWAGQTLSRCDFTPYLGLTSFLAADYYTQFPADTFSGLGVAPTETCN